MNSSPFPLTTQGINGCLGAITVLAINTILSLLLLFAVIIKSRRRHLLFYLNIIMLLSTITQAIFEITLVMDVISSSFNLLLFTIETALVCIIKIIIELILILRLYALYPERYSLLVACVLFVVVRAFLEAFSQVNFFLYGFQERYLLMFIIEPFMGAFNIVFFSSAFILTLVGRICDIPTIKGIRQHRLFLFIVLAIENMIVPCITSSILAIYSLYIHDDITILYRNIILLIHIGVTVVSIIMTTLLGSSSNIQHHSLAQLEEAHMVGKERQIRTLSMAPRIKVLTRVDSEDLKNEFGFSYWGTEEEAIVNI